MGMMSCAELHEVAAEFSLGVLPGVERARALAHLEGCASCRSLVDELSQVSDSLLLLAPEAEPPLGFETRVAERLGLPPRRPRRLHIAAPRGRAVLAAAAATVTVAVGAGAGALVAATAGPATSGAPAVAAARPGALRTVSFDTTGGRPAGDAYAYAGEPAWVFMTVDLPGMSGQWVKCYVTGSGGHEVELGSFHVYDGRGAWGSTLPMAASELHGARLVGPSGATVATARFQ